MSLANLAPTYQTNHPFPHIVIDNFYDPEALDRCLEAWPFQNLVGKECGTSIKQWCSEFNELPDPIQSVIMDLNSPEFIAELEQMTGYQGLIPDPYLKGGGIHHIPSGGFLGVHADFNWHAQLGAVRRLNLLLYLNKDWKWNGFLALCDKQKRRVKEIAPIFNRCVVFSTGDDSWHGHPEPLQCPPEVARRSIALYYYQRAEKPAYTHSTVYIKEAG